MTTITIHYRLSEAGRKASLLAGGNGRREQVVETEVTPEGLALATIDDEGKASLYIGMESNGYPVPVSGEIKELDPSGWKMHWDHFRPHIDWKKQIVEWDGPQTAETLLTWEQARQERVAQLAAELKPHAERYRAWREEQDAAARGAREAKEAECLAQITVDPLLLLGQYNGEWTASVEYPRYAHRDRGAPYITAPPEILAIAEAEAKRRNVAAVAEKEAKAAAALAECEAWVREHGSKRLKLALDTGLLDKSLGAYRDERLALERPGWTWERKGAEVKPIVNPSLEALREYKEAREQYPDDDVSLEWLIVDADDDDDNELRGPALRAVFLGRDIFKWTEK